jgi:hypothetical protein
VVIQILNIISEKPGFVNAPACISSGIQVECGTNRAVVEAHTLGGQVAKAEICSGVCGFNTTVEARKDASGQIQLDIESECKAINRLAAELTEADPYREFTYKGEGPLTFEVAAEHCSHAACPVPVGIIKAIEIEAGLALPADVSIKLSKSDQE